MDFVGLFSEILYLHGWEAAHGMLSSSTWMAAGRNPSYHDSTEYEADYEVTDQHSVTTRYKEVSQGN